MNRERPLQIVLGLTAALFLFTAWPMVAFFRAEPAMSMMFSVYVTLGIFLLLAIPHPEAHRSLIAFTAWSSLAHAVLMGAQGLLHIVMQSELIGSAILALLGIALLALTPKPTPEGAPLSTQSGAVGNRQRRSALPSHPLNPGAPL